MNDRSHPTSEDPLFAQIAALPEIAVDPWTHEKIRKKALVLYQEHTAPSPFLLRLHKAYTRMEPALVAGFGLMYFAWALSRAMGLTN